MAPRAMWTGQLRISLVNFGVRLYAATESSRRVAMNQLHKDCHQRVRNQLVCPTHGPVNREDITKGYEHTKGSYVIIEPTDLESIRLESNKTIELTQFVDADEIDALRRQPARVFAERHRTGRADQEPERLGHVAVGEIDCERDQ